MPTVNGIFELNPLDRRTRRGFAWAELDIPTAKSVTRLPLQFLIDTGSPVNLIMDARLRSVLIALGYKERRDGPPLRWMQKRTDLFTALDEPLWCITGQAPPIFLVRFAMLRLCNPGGGTPGLGDWLGPVHATFTPPFIDPLRKDGAPRFYPLLGRWTLNRIGRLTWNGPGNSIVLDGV